MRHGALGGIAQPVVRGLLQLRSRKRRRRIALLFLLRDGRYLPLGLADGADDLVRGCLILYFNVFAFVFEKLGFKQRRLPGIQHRVDGPVFLRNESADQLFALDNQPQRHRLHASRGKTPAHFVPENRRDFVAHDAIEHAPRLLRIHQIRIDLAGVIEGRTNGLGRNFVEGHAKDFLGIDGDRFFLRSSSSSFSRLFRFRIFLLEPRNAGFLLDVLGRLGENHGQVRRYGLTFAVRVARQIDRIGSDG